MTRFRRYRVTGAIAVLLLTVGGAALAQPGEPQPRPVTEKGEPIAGGPPGQVDNPRRAARRERLRQRIRAMRAWYLTEQLELDDATASRLFPVLVRFDDQIDDLHQRGVQLRRALRRETDRSRPDAAAIDRLIDALLAHYQAVVRVQRDRFAAVRRVVTPTQSAKLLLLLPRIDDAIRRQIQRAMRRGKGGRGGAGDLEEPFRHRRKNRAGDRGAPPDEDAPPSFEDPF
jgi:hypothetical protein